MSGSTTLRSRRAGHSPSRLGLRVMRMRRRIRQVLARGMEKARTEPDEVGIGEPATWRPRPRAMLVQLGIGLVALLLLLWVGRGIVVFVIGHDDGFGLGLDSRCSKIGLSCGALTGFVLPWLSLAFVTTLFLLSRLWFVPRRRKKTARAVPNSLVPTAGAITGQVVGRDELCKVVMDSVHMRDGRRPQLIVGGVGTGKTAVMVELTQLLAAYRATPVAIRMRDVGPDFTFNDVACSQFQSQVHGRLRSGAEGDRIWRYLRQDDRVVVLADGLEEALSEDKDRDDRIRLAIARAREEGLPLVIASRPHDSLRGMDASVLELEPMSEEAALQYLGSGDVQGDPRRVDWIVETAGVTEAPMYLRIAHELNKERMLSHLVRDEDDSDDDEPGGRVNTRDLDRSALRRNLLDTWRTALIRGRLHGDVPLTQAQRQATVALVAALACVGLLKDQLEVKYEHALFRRAEESDGAGQPADQRAWSTSPARGSDAAITPGKEDWLSDRFRIPGLTEQVARVMPGMDRLRGEVNTRLAATWGAQLGLVEIRGEAVRFQHSVLQAYLGSLALENLLRHGQHGPAYMDRAFLGPDRPGRELLIALVLLSRHAAAERLGGGGTPSTGAAGGNETGGAAWIVGILEAKAKDRVDSKALDILAAALEIDAVVDGRHRQQYLAAEAAKRWASFRAADLRTLEEAKLGFVYRFGEALREVDQRTRAPRSATEGDTPDPAVVAERTALQESYRQLFRIGCEEPTSYPVRHAVAQELGAGGMTAFVALRPLFRDAFTSLDTDAWRSDEVEWRKLVMSAWLAPLLLGATARESRTVDGGGDDGPRENLGRWMGRVGRPEVRDRAPAPGGGDAGSRTAAAGAQAGSSVARPPGSPAPDPGRDSDWHGPRWHTPVQALPISVEVALAQGFKYAANRRERHPRAHVEGRTYLSEQSLDLLKRSGFWFSQVTLLQALGLWALPDDSDGQGGRVPGPSSRGLYGPDIKARVRHWVDVAGSLRDEGREPRDQGSAPRTHRFVHEAGDLVIRALKTGRPERYMWIDEHGVTSKIGASAINRAELRKHHLWIPPSIGWSALHPRAQRLVADVLLLANLADRGDRPRVREDRLNRANRRDLPICLTRDREPLDPNREMGTAAGSQPGKNCPGECEFDLCPYPPKGHVNYHAELSETFCRRQETLLGLGVLKYRPGRWQAMPVGDLKKFWREMAKRARR